MGAIEVKEIIDPSVDAAVLCEEVTVRFTTERGTVTALENVNVTVPVGGFLSIVGPSGCGKSTLLRVIADLIAPTAGNVRVNGVAPRTARLRREIGFVFQDAALLPWRTAIENVLLPVQIGRHSNANDLAQGRELLALVGLSGWENAYPHELSGGMRQRVAIARALISGPKLLLMDEPFGALDEITRDHLNAELLDIWDRTKTTIIFITHSIYEAAFLSQQVLLLAARPGRVQERVDVGLPLPRTLLQRETAEFVELAAHLRRGLEQCS